MTRINGRHVIQMLDDDRVVFVDDTTGVEIVMPLMTMGPLLTMWALDAQAGMTFTVKGTRHERITFYPNEYEAVKQALEYFKSVADTPPEQRMPAVVREFNSIDEAMEWFSNGDES